MKWIETIAAFALATTAAQGQVENLWITEVLPSTGEIEVTNIGTTDLTVETALPFCHRFNYGTSVPAGTEFAAGQSRIFSTSFSNQVASDLWIYARGGFGNPENILNGLTWGSAPIGRTGVGVSAGVWDATDSFVPTPAAGQSIQLVGDDPFSAANWAVGIPDLGNFGAVEEPPAIENLWITEVVPQTGEIEVTNVGDTTITTESALPFCHRFNYGTRIPSGTEFLPGQTRVYTTNFSDQEASDIWLYARSGFGNPANILNGLTWGSAPIGRTGVAVTALVWDANDSFVPTPGEGQSIQLIGDNPFAAANWAVGAPDVGRFAMELIIPEPPEVALELELERIGQEIVLTWGGGSPPYQLECSSDLTDWQPVGERTTELTRTVSITEQRKFYRVSSGLEPDETATFRIEISNFFSPAFFSGAESGGSFSPFVGGTHDAETTFWENGMQASPGLARIVEDGSAALFGTEVTAEIAGGGAGTLLLSPGSVDQLSAIEFEFTTGNEHTLLTLASWIAPTPDWFTGLNSANLIGANGDWVSRMEYELRPYDAGTEPAPVSEISSLRNDSRFATSPPTEPDAMGTIGAVVVTRIR